MTKYFNYSWEDFEVDVETIILLLKEKQIKPKCIYGIPKGGLPLAVKLANTLKIPLYTILFDALEEFKNKEDILIVDDISDSGETLLRIPEIEKYITVCLLIRFDTKFVPTIWIKKLENKKWVVFCWEDTKNIKERKEGTFSKAKHLYIKRGIGNIGNQNSKIIKKKISETKKKLYQNPVYRKKQLKIARDLKRREKISKAHLGKTKHTEESKEKLRQAAKAQWARGNKGYHPNKAVAGNRNRRTYIENIMADNLDKNNIKYKEQQRIGKYFPDFIIKNIIVECDGEHWHNKEYDEIRDSFLITQGYKVLRFTSKEIKSNINKCINKIKNTIKDDNSKT